MKRKLTALLLVLVLALPGFAAGAEGGGVFADVLHNVDYGDGITYVVGHKSPDADTIGSAIACAGLLQQLGINAQAVTASEVNRETRYFLDRYQIAPPEILTDAAGKQFVLVDHSEYSQALSGMKNARIVGIIDHHGIGDVRNTERIPVISLPVGSTASIVFQLYMDCNVGISRDMARAMLMSILSDTQGMKSNVTALDRKAYEYLLTAAEIDDPDELYAGMKMAKTSFEGMTPSEMFYSDYKEYLAGEYTFAIGNLVADSEASIPGIAAQIEEAFPAIYAGSYMDMLFCMVSADDTTCIIWYGDDAEAAVRESFPEYDGGSSLVFTPVVSRKTVVVPRLTVTLEGWTKQAAQEAAEPAESSTAGQE